MERVKELHLSEIAAFLYESMILHHERYVAMPAISLVTDFIYISLYFLPDLRKISVKFLKKTAVLSSVAIARRINVKGRGKGSSEEYTTRYN